VNKIMPGLLLIPLCSLSIGVAYSTDAPNGTVRIAAISALDVVARPATPRRAASTALQAPQPELGAVIPNQGANPHNAAAPAKERLDLRPPDLRSVHAQLETEAAPPADAGEPQIVAVMGTASPADDSSNTHLSRTGIGSLYWAARHPAQVWRVLLPSVPGDGSAASEDIRVRCATFVRPLGGPTDCP